MENIIVLFQGDSITDCGRDRKNTDSHGTGYAQRVAGILRANEPYKYLTYNRGISGNRVVDLYARIKQDIINLKPDYMSILIGANDVWHEYPGKNGVSAKKYEKIYSMLIEEVQEALPGIKIMILEPFVLPGSATGNAEEFPTVGAFSVLRWSCGLLQQSGLLKNMGWYSFLCRKCLTA